MRHRILTSKNVEHQKRLLKPYQSYGSFKHPTLARKYVQLIAEIGRDPGLKRQDYNEMVFGKHPNRGFMSTLWADLLYHDFIDYTPDYRYCIRPNGVALIGQAYINSNR